MVQSDKLKKIIAEVKEESSPVITLSNELIADFSKELDSAISELDMICLLYTSDAADEL